MQTGTLNRKVSEKQSIDNARISIESSALMLTLLNTDINLTNSKLFHLWHLIQSKSEKDFQNKKCINTSLFPAHQILFHLVLVFILHFTITKD